ncbi:hypothetical protein L3Q82_017675 [Scortum barcoo]|uniref:Uncharacterized protein n=1 Tax=Scortum barcoo TaxID=214431 RepID=A0ACB8VLQ4_9TELE|nr:hypothetical protein L3Q82_017675 [Scortum barcoo]
MDSRLAHDCIPDYTGSCSGLFELRSRASPRTGATQPPLSSLHTVTTAKENKWKLEMERDQFVHVGTIHKVIHNHCSCNQIKIKSILPDAIGIPLGNIGGTVGNFPDLPFSTCPPDALGRSHKAVSPDSNVHLLTHLPLTDLLVLLHLPRTHIPRRITDEVKMTDKNLTQITALMQTTFALRRKEVISDELPVGEILERWPALAMESQICTTEFHRITNINLKNHCYAELDRHAPCLQSLFRKKAARTGKTAEDLDQFFSAYDLQVSWLHFLVLDCNSGLCLFEL